MYYILYLQIGEDCYESAFYCESEEDALRQAKALAKANNSTEYYLKQIPA